MCEANETGGASMRSTILRTIAAALAWGAGLGAALAQECKPDEIYQVIERTGQRLREINADGQPRLRAKLQELARKNGWGDDEVETKGRAAFEDDETRNLDSRAAELLTELGQLGDVDGQGPALCERLEAARTRSAQLIEVTQQRAAHTLARIDIALRPPAPAPAPATAAPVAAAGPVLQQPTVADAQVRAPIAAPRPKAPAAAGWDTRTVRDTAQIAPAAPVAADTMPPPPPDPGALGFSPEEIRAAGRGFFGTISAGLASVIDHAFQRFGRPTGYVLGNEGGGAFLAGLRYGDGRLVTKQHGERKVYWQGPSAGFDFGVAGSQVMFLVYSIEDHEQLFQRFSGIDGSAYLVGGVGITFLKRGRIILAPIRTGLGLRVGASLGYLKFTPSPSLNPF